MKIDWHQLARERKLWRVIDRAASQRCFYVCLGQVPVFLWLFFKSTLFPMLIQFWVMVGLAGGLVLFMRGAMYYSFDYWHGRSPLQWRQIFKLVNILHLTCYSCIIFATCYLIPTPAVLFFALAFSVTQCVLLIGALSLFRYGIVLLISAHLVPFIILAVLHHEFIKPISGALLFVVLVVFIFEGRKLTYFVWQAQMTKRDNQQLRRELAMMQQSQSKEQHLSHEFLASLSREIRTPMNNVLGMLRLLSETELSVDQRRLQNIATASGENIVMLVEELLDLSNIIGHKLVLDSAVFNIRQCIDATINLLSPMAYEKHTELTHISDPDIPLRVRGDARRISQVLSNVIGFVIDYTEGGEIAVNVHLTPSQVVEGILRIHVSSKHTLMPEKVQEDIQSLLTSNEGINTLSPNHLGLEIAKGVIEAMRGNIGFVASGQHGLTFWITMHITLSTQQTFQSTTPDFFSGKRILLIDMTPGLIESITNDIDSWDMTITSVQGYQKALEVMRAAARDELAFDVAILNMTLEYVGSLKLSTIMGEDPVLLSIKQIILCTVTQRGQNATLKHEGKTFPVLFLTKPFSRGNLYHALVESFGGARPEQKQTKETQSHTIEATDLYRILLVEDNKVNQMVAIGLLKKMGYSAEVCETGRHALEKMTAKHYDLVLMDCNLPDASGYAITADYRKFEQSAEHASQESSIDSRTAIIALTANVAEGEEARCFAAGMDDYLTKPIQADKMAIRLRTWLEKAPEQSGVIHTRHASKNATTWSTTNRTDTHNKPIEEIKPYDQQDD